MNPVKVVVVLFHSSSLTLSSSSSSRWKVSLPFKLFKGRLPLALHHDVYDRKFKLRRSDHFNVSRILCWQSSWNLGLHLFTRVIEAICTIGPWINSSHILSIFCSTWNHFGHGLYDLIYPTMFGLIFMIYMQCNGFPFQFASLYWRCLLGMLSACTRVAEIISCMRLYSKSCSQLRTSDR